MSRTDTGGEEVEPVSDGWAFHGAYPVWAQTHRCLHWADTLAPAIHCFDGQEDRVVVRVDAPITALQVCGDRLLVAHGGRHSWLTENGLLQPFDDGSAWSDPLLNVLCVDDKGRCWMRHAADDSPQCALGVIGENERFQPHWRLGERVDAMAWTNDGATAYAVGAESGTLYMLQAGSQTVRRLASMPKGSGRLSGIALDTDGGIWTALKDG